MEQKIDARPISSANSLNDDLELSSFTQNIAAFENIVSKMENEVNSSNPNADRLNIYQSEAKSILSELQAQQERAVASRGLGDADVQRLQSLLKDRLMQVIIKAEEVLRASQAKLAELNQQIQSANAAQLVDASPEFLETPALRYDLPTILSSGPPEIAANRALAAVVQHFDQVMSVNPQTRQAYLPVLEHLVQLSIDWNEVTRRALDGAPPRGPVDTPPKQGDDDNMESRIVNLEKFAEEARKDLRAIDVRLGKLEIATDSISKNMATRADVAELKGSVYKDVAELKGVLSKDIAAVDGAVSRMESTLLKWFIGTALTMTGLAFTAAKFIH